MTDTLDKTTTRCIPVDLNSRSTAGEALTAYLRAQLDRTREAAMAVRIGEPHGVHDMRVALRRARGALRTYRKVYRKAERDGVAGTLREMKWMTDVLGRARDAEVLQRRLISEVHATPTELVLGPVPAEIDRYLARDTATAQAELLSTLDGERYANWLAEFTTLLATPPTDGRAGRPACAVLPKLARKAYRRAAKAARAAHGRTGTARDEALHDVRKAVKRARYAAEAAAPVVGRPARKQAKRAKQVQQVLGDHHDTVVLRHTLRDLGVRTHLAGENAFTFGLLHGRLGMLALRREHEFPHYWQQFTKSRHWLGG